MIADFADSYASGETPVPCIRCNQTVKFADLTALASDLGAERLDFENPAHLPLVMASRADVKATKSAVLLPPDTLAILSTEKI